MQGREKGKFGENQKGSEAASLAREEKRRKKLESV